jgi:hypothetical protein
MAAEPPGRLAGELVVLPAVEPPARFESWDDAVQSRAFEIWSTIGNRDAGRTHVLLRQECGEDTPLPAASTIRAWARKEAWSARADADLHHSHAKALYELQCGWLAGLRLAQKVLLDGMAGALDDAPGGGLARVKSAEVTLRVIERAGLLAILPQPPEPERADTSGMTRAEAEARAKRAIARGPRGRRS